ncbi:MAG: nitrophenyl compound nitroreductase subunit ArsF family protein [bacterium]|nr:nitrophenyl compound nitroreductase subunit ArsF family protein [bacterium]MDT8396954.1 nitrophenyl compound nitroreductase subunit ArsF family protein [bacterium]
MKKTTFLFLFLAAGAASWISGILPGAFYGPAELSAAAGRPDRVVVYQFHRRFRCEECYKLEAAIGETLNTHFPEQLADGKLVFNVVDLDAEGNGHYTQEYDFFYNTVIVVDVRGGRDVRFKNIEKVWQLAGERDLLMEFVRSEVEEYLRGP